MYEVTSEGRRTIIDVDGNIVLISRNAYDPSNAKFLYRLLPQRMIAQVGNYYLCLRQRPDKKGNCFEYVPNKKYACRDVKRTLAQIKVSVLPSRMWDESTLSVLSDKMLHPYTEYCPSVTLDFYAMDTACGIAHIPYGAEIAHKPQPNNSILGANAKAPRPMVGNIRTVQRLHELDALISQDKQGLGVRGIPYNPYGQTVNNLPPTTEEGDDKKRKAS
jgi:hypothetical protein